MTPPPIKREHNYNPDHPRRPVYFPEITLGNWLTLAAMMLTGMGVYAANESRVTKVETKIEAADVAAEKQLQEQREAIRRIEGRIDKLDNNVLMILTEIRRERRQ